MPPSTTPPPSKRPLSTPPFPANTALARAQSQWLFTLAELQKTPSIVDGLPLATEHANRSKGVTFITQVCIMLKLPQFTLSTAAVYLHRFFMRYSMVEIKNRPGVVNRPGMHHYAVAATSLFLATKVEESSRKMRELIIACCRVAQKQPNMIVDEQSKEYWRWRDTILHNEDLLLEALCFDLQLEQPYKLLLDFLRYFDVQNNKLLRNAAWAFVNDSYLTVICLLFSARTIAASALYAAAKHTGVAFADDDDGRPWWLQLDTDIVEIRKACNRMAEAYENTAIPRQGEPGAYVTTPEDGDEASAKTRITSTTNIHSLYSPALSVESDNQGVKRSRDESAADNPEAGKLDNTYSNGDGLSRSQSASELPRSPKRQRLDRPINGSTEAPPLPPPPPPPPAPQGDDVQSRIDAIINASNSNPPPLPSLSRQNSQNQQWQHPPPRRRSHSSSNRRPDVDTYIGEAGIARKAAYDANTRRGSWNGSQGSGSNGRGQSHDQNSMGRGDSYDRGSRGGSYERERERRSSKGSGSGQATERPQFQERASRDAKENGHISGPSHQVLPPENAVRADGDGEADGNGSEEGEL